MGWGGGRGRMEVQNQEKGRDKKRDTSGMTEGGWGALEVRAEQRGRNSEPNLLLSAASTFHPIVFFSPFFQ